MSNTKATIASLYADGDPLTFGNALKALQGIAVANPEHLDALRGVMNLLFQYRGIAAEIENTAKFGRDDPLQVQHNLRLLVQQAEKLDPKPDFQG